LWAYYEAGFHNLLVVSIEQRYQKEAIKAALGLMGTDQLSLTKCIVTVSAGVNVRDWHAVVREIKENFDPHFDFIMIPKVPLDTLDFTSYKMNLGSKMIIDATRKAIRAEGAKGWRGDLDGGRKIVREDSRVVDCNLIEGTLLIVKVSSDGRQVVENLVRDPRLSGLSMIAAVSDDVEIMNKESYIWGIFTRFDCERDVVFTETGMIGVAPIYKGIMGIDATWKPGYPAALSTPDEIVKRVDEKWGKIWK
jgi:4-hydroxy-3-polyprenylbenzoate decarboxylase